MKSLGGSFASVKVRGRVAIGSVAWLLLLTACPFSKASHRLTCSALPAESDTGLLDSDYFFGAPAGIRTPNQQIMRRFEEHQQGETK
jgi:hypothetical protein